MGPSAVRIAGLGDRISALGYPVVDCGDLSTPIPETRHEGDSRKRYIGDIAGVCRLLYKDVRGSLAAGALPLVIGGDHSLAAGSAGAVADHFAAVERADIGLIWLDAHGDMNTPATTSSGNVHGMPLAALLGPEPAELARIGDRSPKIRADRTVLIGARNLDPLERDQIRAAGIHVFTMKDIDERGVGEVMRRALSLAGADTAGVHVSLDLDVCDPSIAPGVGTPVKGGLAYREAHLAMEIVADSGRLLSLDLVEVNPILDSQNQTAILATELALSALGMGIY